MIETLAPIVTAEWLIGSLASPNIIVLDASWHLPAEARDAEKEFVQGRIPGARRFDFDAAVVDTTSKLPHMMPSAEEFQAKMRALGIGQGDQIVTYDSVGIFSAPRAWWMFKAMGHSAVAVLDGGLPSWIAAAGELVSGLPKKVEPGDFRAQPDGARLVNCAQVLKAVTDDAARILDARSQQRFLGMVPEPRSGLRSGHMPGAHNLPFDWLLREGKMRKAEELRAIFKTFGADGQGKPLIATCGSGVTASIIALASEVAALSPVAVYDGSWAEWGQASRSDLPVV